MCLEILDKHMSVLIPHDPSRVHHRERKKERKKGRKSPSSAGWIIPGFASTTRTLFFAWQIALALAEEAAATVCANLCVVCCCCWRMLSQLPRYSCRSETCAFSWGALCRKRKERNLKPFQLIYLVYHKQHWNNGWRDEKRSDLFDSIKSCNGDWLRGRFWTSSAEEEEQTEREVF